MSYDRDEDVLRIIPLEARLNRLITKRSHEQIFPYEKHIDTLPKNSGRMFGVTLKRLMEF